MERGDRWLITVRVFLFAFFLMSGLCLLSLVSEATDPPDGNALQKKEKQSILVQLKAGKGRPAKAEIVADPPDAPLKVRLRTDKKVYRKGEKIVIFMKGNRPFFAKLFTINPEGNVHQLLPNKWRKERRFDPEKVYRIPDPEAGEKFKLEVLGPPYGKEEIIIYARGVRSPGASGVAEGSDQDIVSSDDFKASLFVETRP